jgi:hypothetical protein
MFLLSYNIRWLNPIRIATIVSLLLFGGHSRSLVGAELHLKPAKQQPQPAIFLSLSFDFFSIHSREQYTDDPVLVPIARPTGIQVPQATQRTNFPSDLVVEPADFSLELAGESITVFATPKIFLRTRRYG